MERYVIRGGREGYERLKVLAESRRSSTLELFELVAFPPGARCVDLGCGGGEVTFDLAQLTGPTGFVVGVDMDEVKLELARAAAKERGIENVEFRHANVGEWNEPDSYDVVYSRFLLQHLTMPVDLLERMWAAVRPGGSIVVEDADFDGLFCDPPNDGFAFYRRSYQLVLARRGGDPGTPRKLYRHFLEAGIREPRLRLVQGVGTAGASKTLPLLTLEAIADVIVDEGVASADEVREALESLAAFTDDPETLVGDPRIFQVWCRRA